MPLLVDQRHGFSHMDILEYQQLIKGFEAVVSYLDVSRSRDEKTF